MAKFSVTQFQYLFIWLPPFCATILSTEERSENTEGREAKEYCFEGCKAEQWKSAG